MANDTQFSDHAPSPRGRAFLRWGIVGGVVLLVLVLTRGFGLLGRAPGGGETPPMIVKPDGSIVVPESSPLRQRITVQPAPAQQVRSQLELPAIVETDPARNAIVLPAAGGRVRELKVGLGERVKRDQILAVIDSPDVAQAYADDDRAAESLKLSGRNLERQQKQFDIGAASERDLDQATSDHNQAAAEYARTQARLKAFGAPAAPPGTARGLSIRAPVSGSLIALSIAPGTMINDATQPIMTVADLSTVWITALVPEKDAGGLHAGDEADVRLAAYPGKALRGKVLFVSDVIEADSRRNKVRIAFANPDYALKPNMFATVVLHGQPRAQVVLPTSALLMNNDRISVFVAREPWTFVRRAVELDLEETATVAIRSGLSPGEQVVVRGGILLND